MLISKESDYINVLIYLLPVGVPLMLFNSYEFIFVFLPISFFVYYYLNHKRLTIASRLACI